VDECKPLTAAATHQLIRDNLHETPTYGGWAGAKAGGLFRASTRTTVNQQITTIGRPDGHRLYWRG